MMMTNRVTLDTIKKNIEDHGYENVLLFDNPSYASAFIGISSDNRAVYIYESMVSSLMDEDGMSYEDAVEFIDYNTLRSLDYMSADNKPVVVHTDVATAF